MGGTRCILMHFNKVKSGTEKGMVRGRCRFVDGSFRRLLLHPKGKMENEKKGKKKKSKNLSETGSGAELGETDEYQLTSKKIIDIRNFFF